MTGSGGANPDNLITGIEVSSPACRCVEIGAGSPHHEASENCALAVLPCFGHTRPGGRPGPGASAATRKKPQGGTQDE